MQYSYLVLVLHEDLQISCKHNLPSYHSHLEHFLVYECHYKMLRPRVKQIGQIINSLVTTMIKININDLANLVYIYFYLV